MTGLTSATVIIGVLIAVTGWGVSHILTVRRDGDRFRREVLGKEVDMILAMVANTFDMALEYHTQDRNICLERKILIAIDRLSHRVQNLPLTRLDQEQKSRAVERIIDYKIAITGKHFEGDHDGPIEGESNQLALCQFRAAELESTILELRTRCHVPLRFIVINYWTEHSDLKE